MTESTYVKKAASGLKGFDRVIPLNYQSAKEKFREGYHFCLRYISREKEREGDLDSQEVNDILNAGLALMPVQHPRTAGWKATLEEGVTWGRNAASHCKTIGIHAGTNVWLDLEGVSEDSTQQEIDAYCNAWHKEVKAGGFKPGLYVGAGSRLSGDNLYYRLEFKHYWKSESTVPDIANRGYQLIQHSYTQDLDLDYTQTDRKGGNVYWTIKGDEPNPCH